jgi:uracil-DNA glycosylase family 4
MPRRQAVSQKTAYELFVERWKDGCGSSLCAGARKVVLARGCVPCDVLFIGEAPGESENVIGQPFVGPAGHLLDHIVERALAWEGEAAESSKDQVFHYRIAFCNVVGCIPRDEEGGKVADPAPADVKACAPRLREFVELANPSLIVCVGAVARKWLDPKSKGRVALHREIPMTDISHPAYILRANIAQRTLLVQRAIVTIATAAQEYLE